MYMPCIHKLKHIIYSINHTIPRLKDSNQVKLIELKFELEFYWTIDTFDKFIFKFVNEKQLYQWTLPVLSRMHTK